MAIGNRFTLNTMISIKQLESGRFFEVKQDQETHLFRLLKKDPIILVAAYWPRFDPTETPELKSNCTEFPFAEDFLVYSGAYAAISVEDLEAMSTYERIREAKMKRIEAFQEMLSQAKVLMEENLWDMAIAQLNEAAPYNKLAAEIYKLRGLCFLHAGNNLLAKADLAFYLEMESDAEIQDILNEL